MVAYDLPTSAGTPPDDPAPDPAFHAAAVVVVLVTRNPGPWFEEALAGIAGQDYPNLSVLVIDAGSEVDPLPAVAQLLPSAYVRHLGANPGFSTAANEVLGRVAGAEFFAFCHDDVVLEPDVLRLLVEEAYRSDAGIVGPKLVRWGDPDHLLQVGMSIDKTGVMAPLVERGELDQEQHDRVRDVFAIPGGCTVVRTELFEALGGFDPGITFFGDDVDLCWRAQVVGARVVVVPAARAQHVEAFGLRADSVERRGLQARHRLRSVLTCYGPFHLLRVLPQALFVAMVEVVVAVVTGNFSRAGDVVAAWWWNLRRPLELRARRRHLRGQRKLPDADVRRLQTRGSAILNAFVRGEVGNGDRVRTSLAGVGRGITGNFVGPRRFAVGTWLLVGLVVVIGSRHLIFGRLSAVGSFAPIGESPLGLLHEYASGWRTGGLGSEAPSPTAAGILGLAGLVFLGAMGLLQKVLVLGALPVGLLGMWRLSAPLASPRARSVAVVAYAAMPLPYSALAQGHWGTLAFFAAAPWLLGQLLRAFGQAPFAAAASSPAPPSVAASSPGPSVAAAVPPIGPPSGPPPAEAPGSTPVAAEPPEAPPSRRPPVRDTAALALGIALVAALVPAVILFVPVIALALGVGALLTGSRRRSFDVLVLAVSASVLAAVLHLPWSFDLFWPGGGWEALGGVDPVGVESLGISQLLRFQTLGSTRELFAWGIPVAAALPLIVGRGWRFAWAGRLWMVALACWSLVWFGGHDAFPFVLPGAEFLLVPAAVALALAVAVGITSVEHDVRTGPLGSGQLLSLVAALALVVGLLPVIGATLDGRWGMPTTDFDRSLTALAVDAGGSDDAFRVLWLGHPDVLPLGSHRLADGLSYGISVDGSPRLLELWPGRGDGGTALVGDVIRLAAAGETQRLGRLLAPLGIRFVALPERAAPERADTPLRPLPTELRRAFDAQLDLRTTDVDPAVTLYENAAWAPLRTQLPDDASETVLEADDLLPPAVGLDLTAAEAVLVRRTGRLRHEGEVEAGVVYVAESASSGWHLEVDGREATRSDALGWANAFQVDEGGLATLQYRSSPVRWLAIALQVAAWLAVIAWCTGRRPAIVTPARRTRKRS